MLSMRGLRTKGMYLIFAIIIASAGLAVIYLENVFAAPNIVANKTDALIVDVGNDGVANPGTTNLRKYY